MNDEKIMSISDAVKDAMKSFNYDFQDRSLESDNYKQHVDSVLMNMFDDKTVTEDINMTGIPDAAVLYIIMNEIGCDCKSIHDFSMIKSRWLSCPNRIGYVFDVSLKDNVQRQTIEIDVNEEGVKCE